MLESRSLFGPTLLFLTMSLIASIACSSSKDSTDDADDASQDAGIKDASGSDDADEAVDREDSGSDAQPDDDSADTHCPNGIPEPEFFEQCDDGNFFDNDGCNRRCEFSCEDDDECDDLNDCNGVETCNQEDHACETGEWADNGTACGNGKTCFEGLCRDNVCGDGEVNPGEDCDDGNNIDDDECSNDCAYGCNSDDDCADGDPCAGTTTCDEDDHKCGGSTLDDETDCKTTTVDDGWCMKNVCVPSKCGNGTDDKGEQCDEGKDNGEPGSGCSIDCKTTDCGNGTIEAEEECDDGNKENLDSCDKNCGAEIYYRWNQLEILDEPSPEWCVYAGKNAFAKAFPGSVPIKLWGETIREVDVLGEINDAMAAGIEDCSMNQIIQVIDLDDPSFKTSDDDVLIGYHNGALASGQTCNHPMDVDSELNFSADLVKDGAPTVTLPAIQRPGLLQSAHPIDIPAPTENDQRAGALLDFKFQWQMDTENASTPAYLERDDGLDPLEIPETMGVNPDSGEPYHAAGRLCAAMSMDGMKATKIIEGSEDSFCCSSPDSSIGVRKYHPCPADDPNGDCESTADIVTYGCVICINNITPSELSMDNLISPDCGGGDFGNCLSFFEVVHPSPADVDTDGDGENDALSIVLAVEGVRVQSAGVKD